MPAVPFAFDCFILQQVQDERRGRAAQDGRMGAAAISTVLPAAILPSFPRKRESRTVLPYNGIVDRQPWDSRLRGNDGRGAREGR